MITVLITGCGGAVGLSAAKALRMSAKRLRIVGVDSDPYSACFYSRENKRLLDETRLVPRAEQPAYIRRIKDICRREKVDVILPCTDAELEKLSVLRDRISKTGTEIIISPWETISVCRDKWLTYQNLGRHLPIVKSALPDLGLSQALKLTGVPAVIKPRFGWGARETYKVKSVEEAKIIINSVDKPIVQTWLEGQEYTVDGLTDKHGKALCFIPRWRIKILGGLCTQAVTVRDEQLIKLGEKITKHLKIIGPFNFQVKKIDGEPKIFEINPRFAGTGILSVKAGVNMPLLALKETCGMKIPKNIDFEEDLFVSRYFEEVFFKREEMKSHED